MRNVLITGVSGLIGTEVANLLLNKGFTIVGTDTKPSSIINPNFTYIEAAPDDKGKISGLFSQYKCDALVHLACSCDNDFPALLGKEEIKIAANCDKFLYEAAVKAGVKDILLLSSHMVYAVQKSREPIREGNDVKPSTTYGEIKADSEKILAKAVGKSSTNAVIMRMPQMYTKDFVENLHSKIWDPKDACVFVYGYGEYGFTFCCLYNLCDFILGILAGAAGLTNYTGIYNICDTKPILAKDIVEFMKQFHRIGAVIQRNYGTDAIKAAMAFGGKTAKADYRYNDIGIICSNISYDNTKAQRIAPFRWKLANTK
ncbi:MAG: NAD(P)-dependent oxidoreductase [Ruminococcus sp.]|jgi:UDP-glucose 4-epimerase|nr:NAD(P)-dependent oxidoreductase [Ruminococcus sp.]